MKSKLTILILLLLSGVPARAQNDITDSVDALHYDLNLDIGNKYDKQIAGSAAVTMRIVRQVDSLVLELYPSTIDSVIVDGTNEAYRYDAAERRLKVASHATAGDTVTMAVYYRKGQSIMRQGWGGFYFDNNIYYNLGIAIYEYPHNVGKAWFPCRDNFTDKATYRLRITAKPGWRAIGSGIQTSAEEHDDGSLTTEWCLDHPTPTYLVGVAVAPFHVIERYYESEYGTYPAILGFLNHDSVSVWNAYNNMSKVIPMYERCFGPYRWDRVGYVSTPMGSMEHSANIAFTTYCMASQDEACRATMSHEFAHSWFGNLVTCATSKDMWINEGGASFCEEVAIQAMTEDSNKNYYRDFARGNLKNVLLSTHLTDGGFKPLYGQTPDYTYGSTVYNKGATVWHSLRGYMGDTLFYSSMRKLFSRAAFQNLDSWQLRDSLSAYSGMDLTAFFDFHVFRPGFVDYVVDSIRNSAAGTTVYIRQKLYGADTLMDGNRVWVTFMSQGMEKEKRLVVFDGESASATFQLPFEPAFVVVDYDEELSKASLAQQAIIKEKGPVTLEDALCRITTLKVSEGDSAWLHVTHHWSRPDTTLSQQVECMADHYWTVTGHVPEDFSMSGMFYFSRSGADRTLDEDWVLDNEDFGRVRLMYRSGAGDSWRVVGSRHTSGSLQTYFIDNQIKKGEYTLAVIDTGYVTVGEVQSNAPIRIYPNPTTGRVTIEGAESDERYTVEVFNVGGQNVVGRMEVVSGQPFDLGLPSGLYVMNVRGLRGGAVASRKIEIF